MKWYNHMKCKALQDIRIPTIKEQSIAMVTQGSLRCNVTIKLH